MQRIVLIIGSTADVGQSIARTLRRGLGEYTVIVETVRYESEAKERLIAIDFDMVITEVDIARDENTAIVNGERRGLSLLKWLQVESGISAPGIIFCPKQDLTLVSAAAILPKVSIVWGGDGFCEDLARAARNIFANKEDNNNACLRVVITLDASTETWSYELKGEGFEFFKPGPLDIDAQEFSDLVRRSRNVPLLQDAWLEEFRKLGEDIMRQIFFNNVKFYGFFMNALGNVRNDLSRIKIWFRITSDLHPIAFEAIVPDEKNVDFWMFKAPIYRRLEEYLCSRDPLFVGPSANSSKIKCLIIDASTSGLADGLVDRLGRPVRLPELPNARKERSDIEAYLTEHKAKFGISRILTLSKDVVGEYSFSSALFRTLDSDTWDLIHYIGHSFYDDKRNQGYMFFPSAKEGDLPEKIEAGVLAPHLTGTRLLYVSSCLSSEQSISASWAQCNIPAAIGYHWQVSDERATEYAIQFYHELFTDDRKSLLHAFAKTRKLLHDKYKDDPIWAAPVLMVQSA